MTNALRSLTLAAVVCGLAMPLAAAPKEGAKAGARKKADKQSALPAGMYKLPEVITLTDEQKPKVEALNKEYAPKFRELAKKNRDLLTKEQRQARRDAMKSAKEAGKKGKQLQADVQAAMQLSAEQKEQLEKLKAETMTLRTQMQEKVVSVLTPEQKEQLPKPKKGKRGAKGKKAAKTPSE
ncbi:MAG: hypothetical protein WBC44_12495 [Planctomycetaceae bacterium]